MLLLEDLDRIDAARVVLAGHHHLAEAALANNLEYSEVLHAQLACCGLEARADEDVAGGLGVGRQHFAQGYPCLLDGTAAILRRHGAAANADVVARLLGTLGVGQLFEWVSYVSGARHACA